jgi:hypothetical protein
MAQVQFNIDLNGSAAACSYEVVGDGVKTITVVTPFGTETTGLGGLPTEILAHRIAEKLARRSAAEPLDFSRDHPPR